MNQQAIDAAIEQCSMLGCDIVDEVHIARKQYLDGPILTGFQRTAVVGVNGKIPFRGRTLSVTQVTVEEDSCREVRDRGHCIVWRADRLGMPLIETVTGPPRTPKRPRRRSSSSAASAGRRARPHRARRLAPGRERLRPRRTPRRDRGPKAGWAPRLVHGEAWRQVNLLKLKGELHRRGFTTPASLRVESQDVTQLFAGTEIPYLSPAAWERWVETEKMRPGFELGKGPYRVRAARLPGLAGRSPWPTQPERPRARARGAGPRHRRARPDPEPPPPEAWPERAAPAGAQAPSAGACVAARTTRSSSSGARRKTRSPAREEIRLRYVDATQGSRTRPGSRSSTG
ncbi:MAG: hypothetical protein IPF66_14870 [Holophagales bacterium]|nr:hypothetical protein [Holophagales bacterium]